MRVYLALFALAAVSYAAPNEKCVVGEWGEWSQCKGRHGSCSHHSSESYKMTDAQKALGKGRKAMEEMMERKRQIATDRQACLANNTCPHLLPKKSQAFTQCVDGLAGEYPCNNVNLLSFLNFEDLGFSGTSLPVSGNDMWVWHDVAFSQYYALMGTTHGTSFVRITDPLSPEVLATLPTHTSPSNWRDMKVVENHAYIVSEASDHGLQVFDLTRLRDMTEGPSVPELAGDAHLDNFGQAHNIAANVEAERLYVIGSRSGIGDGVCAGGLHVIDVSDRLNPVTVECNDIDGYVHDTECFLYDGPDTRYTGRDICFGYNEDSLTIYDADQQEYISRETYNGSRYTHQGWTTESRYYLLLDDELDEAYSSEKKTKTYIWSIEDLENPVLVETYVSSETSIDHNQYIKGDLTFQSNYESGLRVLEIDEVNPGLTEVAYFDVFPSRTEADFYGTWSNYPWLDNNVVALSSIDYGFYLLELDVAAIEAERNSDVIFGEQHRYRKAIYGSDFDSCPTLVERRACVPEQC